MRKIKLETWKAKGPDGVEVEENILVAISFMLQSQENQPKGLDKFRIMTKLALAFDKAQETKVLELEDREYKFVKEIMEGEIPSRWGLNPNLSKAIVAFLDAKED